MTERVEFLLEQQALFEEVTVSRRLYGQTNAGGNFCKSYANTDTGATLPDIPALPPSVVAASGRTGEFSWNWMHGREWKAFREDYRKLNADAWWRSHPANSSQSIKLYSKNLWD